ncbi:MAG: phosphotransferase family protein [Candidatus Bathyarchaeota archaeon]
MINPDYNVEQVSEILLHYISGQLGRALEYECPPVQFSGGQEAYLYRFQLRGTGGDLSRPLVLRLFPKYYPTGRASWDSLIQNTVADSGYPAPRVYVTCTDKAVLGGSFMVMEYIEGEPLSNYAPLKMAALLGRAQAELHSINPHPIAAALRAKGVAESRYRLSGLLDWLHGNISERYSGWLGECTRWLKDNRPEEPEALSVIHGDFHPLNILVRDGEVVGVLDWPNFRLADPSMDIAFTLVLAEGAFEYVMDVGRVDDLIATYLSAYQQVRPINNLNLPYYKALRCVMALQQGADGQAVWTQPQIVEYLINEIHENTDVKVEPPTAA